MSIRIRDSYTFFVVARAGSMQQAAEQLGVTPGAISQRIRALEELHGQRLFSRNRKGITLTPAGTALWQATQQAFSTLETAHDRYLTPSSQSQIRISAAPTYAYHCLVPRLGEFSNEHPAIKISIETDQRVVDLRSEPVDLAIRHGLGRYQGLHSIWLSSPELIVVGSPALLAKGPPIHDSIDCLSYPLLEDSGPGCSDWRLWCDARGLDRNQARFSSAFKDDFLIVKAAVEGQGLALLHDVYVQDDLASGRLIKACNAAWPTDFAYYAVTLPETMERPAIRQFVKWLRGISADLSPPKAVAV